MQIGCTPKSLDIPLHCAGGLVLLLARRLHRTSLLKVLSGLATKATIYLHPPVFLASRLYFRSARVSLHCLDYFKSQPARNRDLSDLDSRQQELD
jgi:hypothetical protein